VRAGAACARPAGWGPCPSWLRGRLPALADGILVVDRLQNPSGSWNFGSVSTLWGPVVRGYFVGSFKLCLISAVAGAVFGHGGLRGGVRQAGQRVRRFALAGSGVLAQFGGVTLASPSRP